LEDVIGSDVGRGGGFCGSHCTVHVTAYNSYR